MRFGIRTWFHGKKGKNTGTLDVEERLLLPNLAKNYVELYIYFALFCCIDDTQFRVQIFHSMIITKHLIKTKGPELFLVPFF